MGKDSRIPTGMYQLSPELKEKLMNINGPLGDVNDVADQLAYAVTGSFDFSVQVQSNDPTVQKLSIMVNFLLETIRRTVNELETKHKFLMETTQTLQESEERFRAMMQSASDAKEAEERIEKSNSLLNATFESIADGIVVVDLAGQTVAFNQKFAQMWDIPDSIIGNTQERLVFIGSQLRNPDSFWQRAEELANQPEAEGYDILELNDGRVIERHSKPQWLGDQVVGRVWNFRDITEQKQAEAILRQNEASMAAAQRIAHLGNWVSNLQTGHLHWSDEIYRIFGLAPQEFSATVDAFFSRVHPDDLAYVNKALEEAMARHKDYNVNHRIVRDNGEVRFVHQEAEITFDEAGKPLQMFGIVQDVTDRRQLELKIQESLERRGRQVQLSTEMAQEIAAATNLNDLYQRVVLQVKTQFDYYYTQLLRYDPAQNVIELVVGYGEVGAQMLAQGYSLPLGVGLIGMAAATGKSILQSDIAADPDWRPNLLLPDTKGELAVPIKLGEQVLGVLDVQSNMTGSLDADDQLVLEGLCGQIAVAIESIQLRQEMEDRLRELNALQRLMSREGWQTFMATRERAVPGYIFDQTSVRPLTGDELGLHGNDVSQKEPTVGTTTSNGHHLVAKPLAVRGEIIGSLGIQDDGDDPLAPEDQAFLDAVTEQVAEALERARLLEQTQKRAMEMETLSQISRRLSAVLDPQQLIAEVVEQVGVAFNYYYTQIYLFDQARENLVLAGGSGETGRLLLARQHSLPKGRGLVGRAAEQNKIVFIPDVQRSIRPEIISQANLEDVYRRETDPVVEAEWYAHYIAHYFGDVKVVRDWLTVNPERTGKALKLGYVLHVPGAFSKMIRRGVEAAARDLQVEVEFVAPVRQGEHLSLFEAMVRQGKDGLVVVPDQPDWVEPIRQAMTANIPVVTANRDLKFSPALMHVGLDNFQAGVMLARELVKLFQAAGQKKGKILVGTGIADRNAGVRHVLRDTNYTLIEIEGFLEDGSFLQTYWEQALSRHPDSIAVMGLTAPELPILAEIKRRTGGQWLLVGFDLEPATLEAIREGIVQVTIGQHPYLQAYLPILALVEHLYLDKSLEGWIAEGWLPNPLLTETQAEVAVPIALRDQVLGVLDVQHNVAGSLKPENANLLRSVADQVAIALQNAHLLTQTQAVLAEMQQSQELLRTTIDATPDWIFIKDRNHRYRLVNQGYANSLHMAPEDFIGKNDLEIGFPEEIVKGSPDKGIRGFWADDLEVMESGQSKFIEVEPAFVDGRPIFLSTIKTPLRDSSGNVWGVLGFVRDITQREQLLAEAESLYEAGRQISEAKDLQEIVAAVAEARLVAIINRVLLFTFERNSLDEVEAMTVMANWHSGQGMLPSPIGRRYDRDAFSTVELMLNPEPLFFNDVQHDERMDAPIIAVAQQQNIRAMAVIPLQLGGRQLGVLLLQAEEVHEFTPREIQFYLSLAPQIAVAIDNQRLLAETRTALAEVEQTQRRYTLQTWETYRDKLTTLGYEQVREGVTPLGDNLLPEIIQTVDQQRRLRASASTEIAEISRPQAITSEQQNEAGSSVIVPLTVRGETIGVLGLQEIDERRKWSPEEIALIEAISEQLAQAAENIRLIDETQQRAAREKRVNEIGEKIQAAQSLEEALKIAVKEVGLSLQTPQTSVQLEIKN